MRVNCEGVEEKTSSQPPHTISTTESRERRRRTSPGTLVHGRSAYKPKRIDDPDKALGEWSDWGCGGRKTPGGVYRGRKKKGGETRMVWRNQVAALTSSSPLLRSRISRSQSSSSPSWPAIAERLLSVRGVKVPPGLVLKAIGTISGIIGERQIDVLMQKKEGLTALEVPGWQRSLSMK